MRDHVLNDVVPSIPMAPCTSPLLANQQTVASANTTCSRSRRCRREKRVPGVPSRRESITATVDHTGAGCSLPLVQSVE